MKPIALLLFLAFLMSLPISQPQAASRAANFTQSIESQQFIRPPNVKKQHKKWKVWDSFRSLFSKKKKLTGDIPKGKSKFGIISLVTLFGSFLLGMLVFETIFLLGILATFVLSILGIMEDEIKWPAYLGLVLSGALIIFIIALVYSCVSGNCL